MGEIHIDPTRDNTTENETTRLKNTLWTADLIDIEWTDQGTFMPEYKKSHLKLIAFTTHLPYRMGDTARRTDDTRFH